MVNTKRTISCASLAIGKDIAIDNHTNIVGIFQIRPTHCYPICIDREGRMKSLVEISVIKIAASMVSIMSVQPVTGTRCIARSI